MGNRNYPAIATDCEQTFRTLKALPVDLFLGAHGGDYGMVEKHAKIGTGGVNPFVDREGYHRDVSEREQAFRTEWNERGGA